jgi:hypothetical protein
MLSLSVSSISAAGNNAPAYKRFKTSGSFKRLNRECDQKVVKLSTA